MPVSSKNALDAGTSKYLNTPRLLVRETIRSKLSRKHMIIRDSRCQKSGQNSLSSVVIGAAPPTILCHAYVSQHSACMPTDCNVAAVVTHQDRYLQLITQSRQ